MWTIPAGSTALYHRKNLSVALYTYATFTVRVQWINFVLKLLVNWYDRFQLVLPSRLPFQPPTGHIFRGQQAMMSDFVTDSPTRPRSRWSLSIRHREPWTVLRAAFLVRLTRGRLQPHLRVKSMLMFTAKSFVTYEVNVIRHLLVAQGFRYCLPPTPYWQASNRQKTLKLLLLELCARVTV